MNQLTLEIKRLAKVIRSVPATAKEPEGTKPCTLCKQTKPLTEFYYKTTRGRYSSRCKSCHKETVYSGRRK